MFRSGNTQGCPGPGTLPTGEAPLPTATFPSPTRVLHSPGVGSGTSRRPAPLSFPLFCAPLRSCSWLHHVWFARVGRRHDAAGEPDQADAAAAQRAWAPPVTLTPAQQPSKQPQLAMDGSGNAVATGFAEQGSGPTSRVTQGARMAATGFWSSGAGPLLAAGHCRPRRWKPRTLRSTPPGRARQSGYARREHARRPDGAGGDLHRHGLGHGHAT